MKATSMRGVTVDFNRMMANHADMPALGNASMNARGDLINAQGNVVKKREEVAMDYHRNASKTVKRVSMSGIAGEVLSPAEALGRAPEQRQPVAQAPKRRLTDD